MPHNYKAQFQDLRDALDVARLMATSTPDSADRDQLDDMLAAFREAQCFLADAISDIEYEIGKADGTTIDMFANDPNAFKFTRDMAFCDIRRTATGVVL
jgi:hypothetical protein